MGSDDIERVNRTVIAQMIACVAKERQGDWIYNLSHVEVSYNSVITSSGVAPNEIHSGRLPRFLIEFSNMITWMEVRVLNATT